ncbi:2-succinyl-5-enolpyruvyl-6-hydroxy-3-cyclohexene-1-carboxylic-acid synthase [Fructilactobacillus hinvesii]|uniref:2-succinyl-5-enolpyruvyl-6-hydroxy-3-cyclohexene-1-carboxylate synthase n=1 Tax=Fructilactobacillus hinvesii TaxID=2940300 RepID=A0ABY5BSW7_9LACO|nr:2-succinyl-5-enolpyruvyl-6-hydroxy-3-cyclohexene-1-carboxylic-acid synthase [Fructilactobacillus hinvesii]USS88222.1 2-succinyl-5-enolpyruvyl-6-hydroxy-3-cyclohexene-1-carboxylic-acid synthase [Fructilactobacillus hinvesii]
MSNNMTTNLKHLILACQNQGVTHFVLSPGSRNTPLALLLAEQKVDLTVAVDERSAAFFALGIAKQTKQPVALVATSGTATANYAPAIAEAHSFHVPLVVITTDRPQELQEIGAPQTIPQRGMYTTNVKQFLEINVQEPHPDVTEYIEYQVQQLVHLSQLAPSGPVQINLPLRKPLLPTLGTSWPSIALQTFGRISSRLAAESLAALINRLIHRKVLLVLGPTNQAYPMPQLRTVANQLQAPIVADVLSSVRGELSTFTPHQLLTIPPELEPDIVLRFGGTPVSGKLLPWLKNHHIPVMQVGDAYLGQDHSRWAHVSYNLSAQDFLTQLAATNVSGQPNYQQRWQHHFNQQHPVPTTLTAQTLPVLLAQAPQVQQLFLANSLTVRNFDQAFVPHHPVQVAGNRGANGIDGTTSSAVGMALNHVPTWLVIGDLAFFHDLNGLQLARQTHVSLTVVVVNNDGGGIFSLLPQAQAPHFEHLFGTPQELNVAAVATLFAAHYQRITTVAELNHLTTTPWTGLRIIEVQTNRTELAQEYPEGLS